VVRAGGRVTLVVAPYDPAWAVRGQELAATLRAAMGPPALRVEHIGSTSIPGMAAKPVLDLQVAVDDLEQAAAAFDGPLAAHGLARSAYDRDHVPAGLDDPPERWRKRLWSGPGVNLHCRLAGSPNERLALLFRDWFRAHPAAVPAYARFKQVLAGAVGEVGAYTDVKDPVVDLVVAAAEEWVAATGWTAEARTVSVTVARDAREVYAYVAEARNLPAWSFVEAVEPAGSAWTATVPGGGRVRMTFAGPNGLGVLDHDVELPTGEVVHVPLQVLPAGAGSVVLFTALRRPGMTDAEYAADVAAVERDLASLRQILDR
jgi:GrpB-like predicted nucleotidyltransferase (UPF0157 family)